MRGSTALAYEADAAVILNEKVAVVAKAHLASTAPDYRVPARWCSASRRTAMARLTSISSSKDFANYRFDRPVGRRATVEEGTIEE